MTSEIEKDAAAVVQAITQAKDGLTVPEMEDATELSQNRIRTALVFLSGGGRLRSEVKQGRSRPGANPRRGATGVAVWYLVPVPQTVDAVSVAAELDNRAAIYFNVNGSMGAAYKDAAGVVRDAMNRGVTP
jgi:hypothetical protein